ncbi:MAG TPA: isochorismatase family protein [Actinomycetota bacterium]
MEPVYGPTTALVVVDVQNDFASPDGSLSVADAAAIVPIVNDHVARARAVGGTVVYTADWHPERTPHFQTDGGIWPVHCVGETWGAEFHPDLVVDGPVVRKGVNGEDGYSGFTTRDSQTEQTVPTELAAVLRERGVAHLVVCGLATDYCVKATALDGLAEGFRVSLLTPAVRAVDLRPGDGDRALEEVREAGGILL